MTKTRRNWTSKTNDEKHTYVIEMLKDISPEFSESIKEYINTNPSINRPSCLAHFKKDWVAVGRQAK